MFTHRIIHSNPLFILSARRVRPSDTLDTLLEILSRMFLRSFPSTSSELVNTAWQESSVTKQLLDVKENQVLHSP